MKKGLRKLILSGTALAAVAATGATSTYAWYTTNPTVSANNIIGASSDAGSSSIYIAKDTTGTKAWSSSVTFASTDFASFKLIPVQPVKSGTTYTAGSFKTLDAADAGATDVFKFTLWFKSSKTADTATSENGIGLYVKSITLSNTTGTLPAADNLLYGDTPYAAADYGVANTAPTYAVDFCRALGMQIVDVSTTTTTYAAGYRDTFALDSYETPITTTSADALVTTGKAHAYYNKVMPEVTDENGKKPGETGYVHTDPLSSNAITAGKALTAADISYAPITTLDPTGTNATARKVDFYVFLNGWNEFCYDACQGQEFTLSMEFTNVAADALNYA